MVYVTCASEMKSVPFEDSFGNIKRVYIPLSANGILSILHDLLAFFACFQTCNKIVVLGVSSGIFFPIYRILCDICGKRLVVNLDGLEWRRDKFSFPAKCFLYMSDVIAQFSSHKVVVDNQGLVPFVKVSLSKVSVIPYPIVQRDYSRTNLVQEENCCLTICRIEPENNIDLLLSGFNKSKVNKYVFVGNWKSSEYGKELFKRYSTDPRYRLLDPIYDEKKIHELRMNTKIYLHGHSVGGSNPSLIEMLPYPASLICYDCTFNRYTVSGESLFFRTSEQLAEHINKSSNSENSLLREYKEYSLENIYKSYIKIIN